MFAIVPRAQEPKKLGSNFFNCSVPSFHIFSAVFSCNRLTECESDEDERDCSYHYNDCGVRDAVDAGAKCYSVVIQQPGLTWVDAYKTCIRRGQKLATMENVDELTQIRKHLSVTYGKGIIPFVGAQLRDRQQSVSIRALYRNIWQWVDGRTIFSVQILDESKIRGTCSQLKYVGRFTKLNTGYCDVSSKWVGFVCEFNKPNKTLVKIKQTDIGINMSADPSGFLWRVSVVKCPSNHVTRDFLSCDVKADCDASYAVTSCRARGVTVPMFVCQRSQSAVHYTLVCDHIQHCSDTSDEDFCKFLECSSDSFKCRNGQCIQRNMQCDGNLDCFDGSDETCPPDRSSTETSSPPGLIFLDGRGNFWMQPMNDSDECPPTHFLCPRGFCLPVYLLCNGIDDCSGREDEVRCHRYECRGFYRCRASKVCLHADNVCDGVPQCPEQDDEMLCDLDCPHKCICQGLAFVCVSTFPAHSYISLRYLDASGSNMTLSHLRDNIHLIAFRLPKCHINSLSQDMNFPNLREIDLSWNKLNRLNMHHLYPLKNLRVFVLTGNPLVEITISDSPEKMILERLDLSHTSLQELSGREFASSPNIKILNISWSKLRSVAEDTIQFTPLLEHLDLRGFHFKHIPKNLFRDHPSLKIVHAENYQLCCKAMLPRHFNLKNCQATRDLLASCEDLLKSNTYRVFLWVFAFLSLVGNVFSTGTRLYQQQAGGTLGSFGVFVTSLSVADFFMGLYLTIIGTADFVYRGRYLWSDAEWKNSAVCHLAGFLCVLSSETSALIICLITLDRFLVLRFPFGRMHFGHRSALAASGAVWAAGISLAIIPLLPVTSHWEFYSQTGICIPLTFTHSDVFHGYDYSFGVSILLNLVLFVLIAVGQVVVYWAVRANTMPSSTNTQARDAAIARRLITVVVSDFLCWFPIGLLGLLASTGTSISGDVNVAVATFVLPVNSALNPFLYTFNLLMEKRRKAQYEQLLKRLEQEKRVQTAVSKDKIGKAQQSVDKDAIIQQIKTLIGKQVLTSEDILSCSPQGAEQSQLCM